MKSRLAYLRVDQKLTTRAFGEKLGLSGGAITNMEKGTRNITDRTIADICRTFNVNEQWFRTGEGEMYIKSDDSFFHELAVKYNLDDTGIKIVQLFCELPEENRNALEKFLESFVETEKKKSQESSSLADEAGKKEVI